MSKGAYIGLAYYPEGEYELRGGLGNGLLLEMKIEDGIIYVKKNDEWVMHGSQTNLAMLYGSR